MLNLGGTIKNPLKPRVSPRCFPTTKTWPRCDQPYRIADAARDPRISRWEPRRSESLDVEKLWESHRFIDQKNMKNIRHTYIFNDVCLCLVGYLIQFWSLFDVWLKLSVVVVCVCFFNQNKWPVDSQVDVNLKVGCTERFIGQKHQYWFICIYK